MGIKIKNLQTGEFEKFNIPALKGEKGEPGEIEPSEKVDYIGKQHSKLRDTMNANVDYAVKTAIGEFNYLDYDGQHITATDTIEGRAKSAILKGNTLVNLSTLNGEFTVKPNSVQFISPQNIKQNTIYTIMFNCSTVPTTGFVEFRQANDNTALRMENIPVVRGDNKFKTTTVNTQLNKFRFKNDSTSETDFIFNNLVILEGDYTNEDIPFFEGMQSVKMPVLTTTGKNLLEGLENGSIDSLTGKTIAVSGESRSKNYMTINGKPFTISRNVVLDSGALAIRYYDINKNYIGADTRTMSASLLNMTFTPPTNAIYVKFKVINSNLNILYQVEQGTVATTYEPHKSNILTANEDVTLRSNGSVCDELDLLTGKLTQRIDEDGEILAQEVVKTVDLSDNVVYSYDEVTHYDCSSEEGSLVPTLSVKVPTDTQLTIQEQKATTQTLLIKNMDLQQSIKEVQAMNLAFNTALYNSFNSIREEVEDIKKHVSTNENLEGSF